MSKQRDETPSTHHRLARVHGGSNESRNLIKIPKYKHEAFNTLFTDTKTGQQMTTEQIVNELNTVWIDPDVTIMFSRKPK